MSPQKSSKKHRPRKWRSVFGPDEVIQRVRPHETDAYLDNPHRGTTTFQRFNGDPLYPGESWSDREGPLVFRTGKRTGKALENDRYPKTTLSYCRWLWSVIEPQKGQYRWDLIDGALATAAARGQTLQVRIQPYIGTDIPTWYWDVGGTVIPCSENDDRADLDHNNPLYLKHWGDLIRAFGKRYDGHPRLESFDIAYGGSCGEGGGNTSPENAATIVDFYRESFPKTQLVSMLGTHGCSYAAQFNLGWRADCFGDVRHVGQGMVPDRLCWNHMEELYPKEVEECGVKVAWLTAPVTLETCWTVGHWYQQGWDVDWILEQGLKYHLSVFMPKSCAIPDEWREKIDAFDRRLGYRFVLRQMILPLEAKPGQRIQSSIWIDNVGVAPIYRPYCLAYRFRQGRNSAIVLSKQDLRTWMPDHTWFTEKLTFPKSLQRGEVKIDVGIVDPKTREPRVKFAIKETGKDGWHPMTSMDVL